MVYKCKCIFLIWFLYLRCRSIMKLFGNSCTLHLKDLPRLIISVLHGRSEYSLLSFNTLRVRNAQEVGHQIVGDYSTPMAGPCMVDVATSCRPIVLASLQSLEVRFTEYESLCRGVFTGCLLQ
jgi:hypothetical protein